MGGIKVLIAIKHIAKIMSVIDYYLIIVYVK